MHTIANDVYKSTVEEVKIKTGIATVDEMSAVVALVGVNECIGAVGSENC